MKGATARHNPLQSSGQRPPAAARRLRAPCQPRATPRAEPNRHHRTAAIMHDEPVLPGPRRVVHQGIGAVESVRMPVTHDRNRFRHSGAAVGFHFGRNDLRTCRVHNSRLSPGGLPGSSWSPSGFHAANRAIHWRPAGRGREPRRSGGKRKPYSSSMVENSTGFKPASNEPPRSRQPLFAVGKVHVLQVSTNGRSPLGRSGFCTEQRMISFDHSSAECGETPAHCAARPAQKSPRQD